MARKRRSPESLTVASCKSLKRRKVKAVPAFEPIIRTRGQAMNDTETTLNNDKVKAIAAFKPIIRTRGQARNDTETTLNNDKVKAIPAFEPIIRTRGQARTDTETTLNNNKVKAIPAFKPIIRTRGQDRNDAETRSNNSKVKEAIPAFEPIIRTRGQARNDTETKLNNDNISVHANDLQGPKIPVKRSIAVVSIHTSQLENESPALQKKTGIELEKTRVDMPTKGVPSSLDVDPDSAITILDNDGPPLYIELERAYYRFHDVPGDGNCLFNALAKIPAVPFSSAQEVRNAVVSYVLHGQAADYRMKPTANRTLQNCTRRFYNEDIEQWATRIKQCGAARRHWGTAWEATIIAYMCGIKIIVLANLPSGFEKVSSEWTLRMNKGGAILDSFRAECDTFYLLHHQCGSPGALSDPAHCNHFAFLQAVASIPSNANIVCFSGQNQPDFYDFYRDKKEDSGNKEGLINSSTTLRATLFSSPMAAQGGDDFSPRFTGTASDSGNKEDLIDSSRTLRATLFSPPMGAQDGGHFPPRFTGTVSEQLALTTTCHKGVKQCTTARKDTTRRQHAKPSYHNDLVSSEIKLLIDSPSEQAEALKLAEGIAAAHTMIATASARLNYLLQSKSQNKTISLHNTHQGESPERVEVCAIEAKMSTPDYIGCAEATAMKKRRVERMEEAAIHLKRKRLPKDVIKRVEPSKNSGDQSLTEVVASLFPDAAKKVGSPKNANVAVMKNRNSKVTSTSKPMPKANLAHKGRTSTKRAPRRITQVKSYDNRRTLKRIAQALTERMWPLVPGAWPGLSQSWPSFDVSLLVHDAILPNYGGAKRLDDCRRKKPKNIILTQNEASAQRFRESIQFSEDSKKHEYVFCHEVKELLDAISDKEKRSQHAIEGIYKPAMLDAALANETGKQLFTSPMSVQN